MLIVFIITKEINIIQNYNQEVEKYVKKRIT